MTRGVLARTGISILLVVVCVRALSSYVVLSDKWPDGHGDNAPAARLGVRRFERRIHELRCSGRSRALLLSGIRR
jgi:hypothetical protein